MSEAKHAPGPYHATGLTAISGANRIIANVTPAGEFAAVAEVEATRALFVAAPDMAAALAVMVSVFNTRDVDPLAAMVAIEKARAAIAKAEGHA